jgi:DegV family protein with EDD domain
MEDFIIATASTCDADREWLDANNIPMISYTFEVNEKVYIDDCKAETKHALFHEMREGHQPRTSQITAYAYYEFFKELLEKNKNVLFLDMDKALSSSYFNSQRAYEDIKEEFPDNNLVIVDTRCVTMGLTLLLKKAIEMKNDGKSMDEVHSWIEENKLKFSHRFLVDDLEWLRRGGRLSNASAMVGSLLSIKPLIYIDDEGKLLSYSKVRGKKKAIKELLASIDHDLNPANAKEFIVGHSDAPEEAEKFVEQVKEKYPNAQISVQELGPVIGCHVGPGFLAIVYISDTDHRIA